MVNKIKFTKLDYMLIAIACIPTVLAIIYMHDINAQDGTLNDTLRIKGQFILDAYHADGIHFAHTEKDNLVVTNGFKGIGKLGWNANSGISPSTYRYLAVGATSTSPSRSDTALGSECGYSRQLTSSPTYSSAVITLSGTFTGASCTAVEVGVFDASSSGNMLSRQTYSAITLGSSDSLVVTYTFTLS